jgi:hypothetical protein
MINPCINLASHIPPRHSGFPGSKVAISRDDKRKLTLVMFSTRVGISGNYRYDSEEWKKVLEEHHSQEDIEKAYQSLLQDRHREVVLEDGVPFETPHYNPTTLQHYYKYAKLSWGLNGYPRIQPLEGLSVEQTYLNLYLYDHHLNRINSKWLDLLGASVGPMSLSEKTCYHKHLITYNALKLKPLLYDKTLGSILTKTASGEDIPESILYGTRKLEDVKIDGLDTIISGKVYE